MTNKVLSNPLCKPVVSLKTQTLAALAALVAAVALPQFFHVLGRMSGLGTALGEVFLPMHLPIILVGLLAGAYAGAIAGFFAPLFSFLLSGMPGMVMLPFMMIELCAYGLFAGLLRNRNMPVIGKVFCVQLAGRLIRGAAILFAVFVLGNEMIAVAVIWKSIVTGIFGLVLQWTFIPLMVYRVEHGKDSE